MCLGLLKKPVFFTIQLIFSTIHGSHYTFWYYSWPPLYYFNCLLVLSTIFLAKSFQFQLNKLFPNRHLMRNNWRKWLKQIWVTSSSNDVEINGGQWKIRMPDSGKRPFRTWDILNKLWIAESQVYWCCKQREGKEYWKVFYLMSTISVPRTLPWEVYWLVKIMETQLILKNIHINF